MGFARCRMDGMLLLAMLGSAGCLAVEDDQLGTIGLELVGQAPSGAVYRLRDAVITVQGPTTTTIWNTEDAPDRTSLSESVVVGDYAASVQAGWRLERLDGSMATPVAAQLASDNPVLFTVTPLQRTNVPLQFRVNAEVLDMSQGYDIVVSVEESLPLLAVTSALFDGSGALPGVGVFAASANGNVSPIRAISGFVSGLLSPTGVAVAGDQLIVADRPLSVINFYPITATGEVTPTRQIGGGLTGLSSPLALAVFEGEIYVAQSGGPVVVFPLSGTGDISPSRMLFPPGSMQSLAVDRGRLYVLSSSAIMVYPTTAAGFPQPERTIFPGNVFCARGILVRGDEIFVTDGCGAGVSVYPATADGFVSPLRVIAGGRTGLDNPAGIARFGDELYVSGAFPSSVRVFPIQASGDVFPTRAITGAQTDLTFPHGVFVF
jgi:hypothetical protein